MFNASKAISPSSTSGQGVRDLVFEGVLVQDSPLDLDLDLDFERKRDLERERLFSFLSFEPYLFTLRLLP
jgi:hypothetical protein